MSPDRWKQVQTVFHAVLEHSQDRRGQALTDLCSGDTSLRREVQSLLDSHDDAEEFLSTPAFEARVIADEAVADEAVAEGANESLAGLPSQGDLSGTVVGHYEILHLLGAGGMGEVYQAKDQRLGREVALKILPSSFPANEDLAWRFEQEIRAVSAFNHPNICHLYDMGYWQGRPYFTMELLEGKTLRDHIAGRPLPVREILNFGIQIAAALVAAHAKGMIHRDIKPANLFVTDCGPLKVLDFGLARRGAIIGGSSEPTASAFSRTMPGAAMGTVAYMSPEQARAEDLDLRTDLFSFGVVLYEMATGVQPFRGSSNAVIFGALLNQTPVSPSQLNPQITEDLERVVMTALEKDREIRFQSAAEMRAALWRVQRAYDTPATAFAVATAGGSPAPRAAAPEEFDALKSLAVLPFQLLRGERDGDEYLGLGLADALITRLNGMKRLVVRPTSCVFKYANQRTDLQTAGRELGVTYVIGGLIRRSGDHVRITVQLVSVRTGAQVWGAQLDETFTSLMSLEDSLARLAAEAIVPRLNAEEKELLGKRDTDNPRAYEAWLRGRYHWTAYTPEGMGQALVCFMDATAKTRTSPVPTPVWPTITTGPAPGAFFPRPRASRPPKRPPLKPSPSIPLSRKLRPPTATPSGTTTGLGKKPSAPSAGPSNGTTRTWSRTPFSRSS
jgi:TolB-like protein